MQLSAEQLRDSVDYQEWRSAMHREIDKYGIMRVIEELESLLETNSTQAYWPAIIKERIKQLKGE